MASTYTTTPYPNSYNGIALSMRSCPGFLYANFKTCQLHPIDQTEPIDFVVMGILLLGTGLLCEFAMRKVTKIEYRIALFIAIIVTFLLIWAELAVGIFGTPFAGS